MLNTISNWAVCALPVLGIALAALLAGCDETILHDLDEIHANRVRLTLAKAGIDAHKVREGTAWSVAVDESSAAKALAALEDGRVLRRRLPEPLESTSTFISSREERTHFLERRRAAQIEQTLERLPHVLEARVHLHLQPRPRLALMDEPNRQTASVLLVLEDEKPLDAQRIKKLVGGASGMPADAVTVVTVSAAAAPRPPQRPPQRTVKRPPELGALAAALVLLLLLLLLIWVRRVAKGQRALKRPSSKPPSTARLLRPPQQAGKRPQAAPLAASNGTPRQMSGAANG